MRLVVGIAAIVALVGVVAGSLRWMAGTWREAAPAIIGLAVLGVVAGLLVLVAWGLGG